MRDVVKGFRIDRCDLCSDEYDSADDALFVCEVCGLDVCAECVSLLPVNVCIHCVEGALGALWPEVIGG